MRDFQLPGRSAVYAENGLCATSHPLAAKVAIDMLESGGNAMDAAIAAGVLLGICEPQMTGIGGDCFVLVKPAQSEEIFAMNGSGRAPMGLDAADLRAKGQTQIGLESVESITMPGAMDAFCSLSEQFGRKGIDACLAPSIHYADAGVPVAPRTAFDWAEARTRLSGAAREYYLWDGQAPKAGQMFRSPGQAEVLRRVAKQGRSGFYEGEVADDMLGTLHKLGGPHQQSDFDATICTETTPISDSYKGMELVEHPPNGQGATALLINNILSQFDIAAMDPFGSARAHIEAEAAKLAYDARNRFLADADHMTMLAQMLSHQTARDLADLIDPRRVLSIPDTRLGSVHKDTVYLTVVDKDRMAVSLIYSIFHSFGAGIASEKFGILFQNRGAGFTLEEGHPNEAKGGKRPMHTIIPAMLKQNGKVIMPFGVMGGQYQPLGHARLLSNLVDFGMDLQSAVDAPRSFADEAVLKVERGYSEQTRSELAELGHNIQIPPGPIGGAQAIWIDHSNGVLIGASDPRKDGCALGY